MTHSDTERPKRCPILHALFGLHYRSVEGFARLLMEVMELDFPDRGIRKCRDAPKAGGLMIQRGEKKDPRTQRRIEAEREVNGVMFATAVV
ncbi:hypothetical protein F6R98_14460 [Candidatus Methylospira mobilis]|uniref:Transposase n=1 Tax=Candidatus Methylospira mobilis TaxID=1808979 RepID=A0A5Q0BJE4_9GAMM|nr:hypothetical protein [Candidatus Methylospira mobilis]QFY43679.1 hypothetical protein F6R98_14460 [Candidatus Methylospira mobilis]WNV04666.1 hypothetical protein RP726_20095 [Candidatus Methylospira mobilis]